MGPRLMFSDTVIWFLSWQKYQWLEGLLPNWYVRLGRWFPVTFNVLWSYKATMKPTELISFYQNVYLFLIFSLFFLPQSTSSGCEVNCFNSCNILHRSQSSSESRCCSHWAIIITYTSVVANPVIVTLIHEPWTCSNSYCIMYYPPVP